MKHNIEIKTRSDLLVAPGLFILPLGNQAYQLQHVQSVEAAGRTGDVGH